ncbi:MAG: sulfotransferase [Myxococcota bacterium]
MDVARTIEGLLAAARGRTGLSDVGAEDTGWRDALARLVESAEREARLADRGRAMLHAVLTERLVNRLSVIDYAARHPEVRHERVAEPLILATLPRTGQTAAGWILDRDPRNRSLLTWFAKHPIPPPLPGRNSGDPRVAQERALVGAMPRALLEMHLIDAEEPDECHWLISNALRTPHELYSMHVPTYYRWVRDDPGMRAAYAFFHLQLQILQSRTPGRRWVLKNSPHLLALDSLHAVLPDAILVQFHRDPLKVLASNCKLTSLLRGLASDAVDPHAIGRDMLQLLGDYVSRLLDFRARGVSRRWIDVRFRDFVADPLRTVEAIYARAGFELADATRADMAGWVAAHPRQDLVRARAADLAPWGIAPEEARAVFADYCERFGVECDGI